MRKLAKWLALCALCALLQEISSISPEEDSEPERPALEPRQLSKRFSCDKSLSSDPFFVALRNAYCCKQRPYYQHHPNYGGLTRTYPNYLRGNIRVSPCLCPYMRQGVKDSSRDYHRVNIDSLIQKHETNCCPVKNGEQDEEVSYPKTNGQSEEGSLKNDGLVKIGQTSGFIDNVNNDGSLKTDGLVKIGQTSSLIDNDYDKGSLTNDGLVKIGQTSDFIDNGYIPYDTSRGKTINYEYESIGGIEYPLPGGSPSSSGLPQNKKIPYNKQEVSPANHDTLPSQGKTIENLQQSEKSPEEEPLSIYETIDLSNYKPVSDLHHSGQGPDKSLSVVNSVSDSSSDGSNYGLGLKNEQNSYPERTQSTKNLGSFILNPDDDSTYSPDYRYSTIYSEQLAKSTLEGETSTGMNANHQFHSSHTETGTTAELSSSKIGDESQKEISGMTKKEYGLTLSNEPSSIKTLHWPYNGKIGLEIETAVSDGGASSQMPKNDKLNDQHGYPILENSKTQFSTLKNSIINKQHNLGSTLKPNDVFRTLPSTNGNIHYGYPTLQNQGTLLSTAQKTSSNIYPNMQSQGRPQIVESYYTGRVNNFNIPDGYPKMLGEDISVTTGSFGPSLDSTPRTSLTYNHQATKTGQESEVTGENTLRPDSSTASNNQQDVVYTPDKSPSHGEFQILSGKVNFPSGTQEITSSSSYTKANRYGQTEYQVGATNPQAEASANIGHENHVSVTQDSLLSTGYHKPDVGQVVNTPNQQTELINESTQQAGTTIGQGSLSPTSGENTPKPGYHTNKEGDVYVSGKSTLNGAVLTTGKQGSWNTTPQSENPPTQFSTTNTYYQQNVGNVFGDASIRTGYPTTFGATPQQTGYPTTFGATTKQTGYPTTFGATTQQTGYPSMFGATTQQTGYPTTFGATNQQTGYPTFGDTIKQTGYPTTYGDSTTQTGYSTTFGATTQQTGHPSTFGEITQENEYVKTRAQGSLISSTQGTKYGGTTTGYSKVGGHGIPMVATEHVQAVDTHEESNQQIGSPVKYSGGGSVTTTGEKSPTTDHRESTYEQGVLYAHKKPTLNGAVPTTGGQSSWGITTQEDNLSTTSNYNQNIGYTLEGDLSTTQESSVSNRNLENENGQDNVHSYDKSVAQIATSTISGYGNPVTETGGDTLNPNFPASTNDQKGGVYTPGESPSENESQFSSGLGNVVIETQGTNLGLLPGHLVNKHHNQNSGYTFGGSTPQSEYLTTGGQGGFHGIPFSRDRETQISSTQGTATPTKINHQLNVELGSSTQGTTFRGTIPVPQTGYSTIGGQGNLMVQTENGQLVNTPHSPFQTTGEQHNNFPTPAGPDTEYPGLNRSPTQIYVDSTSHSSNNGHIPSTGYDYELDSRGRSLAKNAQKSPSSKVYGYNHENNNPLLANPLHHGKIFSEGGQTGNGFLGTEIINGDEKGEMKNHHPTNPKDSNTLENASSFTNKFHNGKNNPESKKMSTETSFTSSDDSNSESLTSETPEGTLTSEQPQSETSFPTFENVKPGSTGKSEATSSQGITTSTSNDGNDKIVSISGISMKESQLEDIINSFKTPEKNILTIPQVVSGPLVENIHVMNSYPASVNANDGFVHLPSDLIVPFQYYKHIASIYAPDSLLFAEATGTVLPSGHYVEPATVANIVASRKTPKKVMIVTPEGLVVPFNVYSKYIDGISSKDKRALKVLIPDEKEPLPFIVYEEVLKKYTSKYPSDKKPKKETTVKLLGSNIKIPLDKFLLILDSYSNIKDAPVTLPSHKTVSLASFINIENVLGEEYTKRCIVNIPNTDVKLPFSVLKDIFTTYLENKYFDLKHDTDVNIKPPIKDNPLAIVDVLEDGVGPVFETPELNDHPPLHRGHYYHPRSKYFLTEAAGAVNHPSLCPYTPYDGTEDPHSILDLLHPGHTELVGYCPRTDDCCRGHKLTDLVKRNLQQKSHLRIPCPGSDKCSQSSKTVLRTQRFHS